MSIQKNFENIIKIVVKLEDRSLMLNFTSLEVALKTKKLLEEKYGHEVSASSIYTIVVYTNVEEAETSYLRFIKRDVP